jgi:hypothetical protein
LADKSTTDDPKQLAVEEQESGKEFTPPPDEFDEFLTKMRGEISSETTQRNTNFQRARASYQMYRGMIGRPFPDIPYEGSADIRYRHGMQAIRQTRPDFVAVILEAPRITRITPYQAKFNDSADRLEGYYETLYRGTMEDCFADAVCVGYGKAGIEGRTIAKIVWRTETRLTTEDRPRETFVQATVQAQKAKYAKVLGPIMLQNQQEAAQSGKQPEPPTKQQISSAELTKDDMRQVVADVMGWSDPDKEGIPERITHILEQVEDSDNETIEVVVDKIIYNQPWVVICNYEDVVVPSDTGRIRNARWICHKLRMTDRELESKKRSNGGNYRDSAVDAVIEEYNSAPQDIEQRQMETTRRRSEGLQEVKDNKGQVNVWEFYCWVKRSWIKKFNGKTDKSPDLMVKAVLTFCPQLGEKPNDEKMASPICLRAMELPYNHGMWPFEDYYYNYTEDRFYEGEGIIGLGWPLEMEYNTARNAAINRSTLAMNPPGFYMEDCGFEPSSVRQYGQMHPVDNADYVATQGKVATFMDYPNLAQIPEYDAEAATAQFNNLIGIVDQTGLKGYATAPTAEQVQANATPAQKVQKYEMANWLRFWGRIFLHVHLLCKQYLFLDNDEGRIEYRNQQTEQAAVLTQADFEPKYIIAAGGDPQTIGGAVLLDQKLVWSVQFITQNPAIAPFVEFYDAIHAVFHRLLPYNIANSIIPPREKAKQMQQLFMQMQAQAMAKLAQGKRPPRQQKNTALQSAASNLKPR